MPGPITADTSITDIHTIVFLLLKGCALLLIAGLAVDCMLQQKTRANVILRSSPYAKKE